MDMQERIDRLSHHEDQAVVVLALFVLQLAERVNDIGHEMAELNERVRHIMTSMSDLKDDYESFKSAVQAKQQAMSDKIDALQEIIDNSGTTIPADVQTAINDLDAEVKADITSENSGGSTTTVGTGDASGTGTGNAGDLPSGV